MADMDAAIYIRVSSDEQVTGTSLATQEADCRAYCAREGLGVARVFADRGESARSADRPQFLALVDYVAKYRPAAVVVWKFDRWARNAQDHAIYSAAIAKHGARLLSATERTEDNPAGRMLETILSAVAQFDNEVRADRAARAMRDVASRGGWCSLTPFGFRRARVNGLPIMEPDPDRAGIVRDLFTGIAGGRRNLAQTIAVACEHRIAPNACRKMLKNEVYAGVIRNRLTGWRAVAAAFPGLVPQDVFDAVQEVLSGRRKYPARAEVHEEFPLRGLLLCSECGARLTGSLSRGHLGSRYGYYHCRCGAVRLRAARVHEAIIDRIRSDAEALAPILVRVRARLRTRMTSALGRASTIQRRAGHVAGRIIAQREKLLDVYLSGALAKDAFVAKDAELGRKLAEAQKTAVASTAWAGDVSEAVDMAVRIFDDPVALWGRLNTAQRRLLIAGLYGSARIGPAGIVEPAPRAGLTGAIRALTAPEITMAPPSVALSNLVQAVSALAELVPAA
jgi:DNA invertase Pin-like site-specific DNA recombinase